MLTLDFPALDSLTNDPNGPFAGDLVVFVTLLSSLICVWAWYSKVWSHRHSPGGALTGMAQIGLAVVFSASLSFWWPYVVATVQYPAIVMAQHSNLFAAQTAYGNFQTAVSAFAHPPGANAAAGGVLHYIFNAGAATREAIFSALYAGIAFLLSILSAFMVIPFYIVMQVVGVVGLVFLPLAIVSLNVPVLQGRGLSYISWILSVASWPVGFAVLALCVNLAFTVPFHAFDGGAGNGLNPVNYGAVGDAGAANALLAAPARIIVAGLITIFGTPAVPAAAYALFVSGSAEAFSSIASGAAGKAAEMTQKTVTAKATNVAKNLA